MSFTHQSMLALLFPGKMFEQKNLEEIVDFPVFNLVLKMVSNFNVS